MRATSNLLRVLAPAAAGAVVLTGAPMASATVADKPGFQMPFTCGESWDGSTRPTHSPSPDAIDWTRDSNDLGHLVVATAPGTVASVIDLGASSYGLYVVIDHGTRWSTLHAHLLKSFVVRGERVDQGQVIGELGNSGGSTGPHLHYEQRLNKTDQPAVFNRARFPYNSWLKSHSCDDVPLAGDWNGDRGSDVGVFRRHAKAAVFRRRLPDGTVATTPFGLPTDTPLVGDWNGDGKADIGVWSASTSTFTLQTAAGRRRAVDFGKSKDLPVVGDWNGDGRTDLGTYSPATGTFRLRAASGNITTQVFGPVSGIPIAGDWNGDSRSQVGVYDPSTTTFSLARPDGTTRTVSFGTPTSLPVVGDWNADGRSDVAVWDTTTAVFSERVAAKRVATVRFGRIRH